MQASFLAKWCLPSSDEVILEKTWVPPLSDQTLRHRRDPIPLLLTKILTWVSHYKCLKVSLTSRVFYHTSHYSCLRQQHDNISHKMFASSPLQFAGGIKPRNSPFIPNTHWTTSNSEVKKQHIHKHWLFPSSCDCQLWLCWWARNLLEMLLNTLRFTPHKKTAHLFFFFSPNTEFAKLSPCQINLGKLLWCQMTEIYMQWRSLSAARSRNLQLGPLSFMGFCCLLCEWKHSQKKTLLLIPAWSLRLPCGQGDVWEKWGSTRNQQDKIQVVTFRYIEVGYKKNLKKNQKKHRVSPLRVLPLCSPQQLLQVLTLCTFKSPLHFASCSSCAKQTQCYCCNRQVPSVSLPDAF